jgi:hypothetical protein
MRTLILLCCVACAATLARAQSSPTATQPAAASSSQSEPADVVVVKHSWQKERIGWERDPFGGTAESFSDMRRRPVDDRRNERARGSGSTYDAKKVDQGLRPEQVVRARAVAPPRYAFAYKAKIRNGGAKAIREIDWDYVFFDATTGEELGRREFANTGKISSGKSKELSFRILSPPTKRVSVHSLGKKEREGLRGQIVIVRVEYVDGTVWRRP